MLLPSSAGFWPQPVARWKSATSRGQRGQRGQRARRVRVARPARLAPRVRPGRRDSRRPSCQEKVVTVEKPVVVEKVVEKVVERASSRLVAWTGPTIGSVGPGADLWTKLDALFADMHPEIQLTRSRPARPKGKSNDDVLIAAAAAGIAPDVYSVNVTAWQQARLVELGLPLALDRYYAQKPNLNRIYRWMREQARFNGRLYGVPHEMEFIAFWYNAKVFEKHGLEIPSTWEELLKAAQTLLSAKVMPIAEQAHWNYGHLYSLTLAAIGGKEIVDDIVAGNKRWDSADPIKAAEVILDLQRRGYLPPNPTDEGDPAYPMGASFVSGKVGMWATGTWSVGWMQQQANEVAGGVRLRVLRDALTHWHPAARIQPGRGLGRRPQRLVAESVARAGGDLPGLPVSARARRRPGSRPRSRFRPCRSGSGTTTSRQASAGRSRSSMTRGKRASAGPWT